MTVTEVSKKVNRHKNTIDDFLKRSGVHRTIFKLLTDEEKSEITRLYNEEKLSCSEIHRRIGRPIRTIAEFVNKNNFEDRFHVVVTDEEKEDIKEKYLSGMTCKEIYNKYYSNRFKGFNTIKRIIRPMGIMRLPGVLNVVDDDYFEQIDDSDKAYFLGFMMADGCVTQGKFGQKNVQMNLQIQDKYMVEKFNELLGSDNEIFEFDGGKYSYSKDGAGWQARFKVSSDKLADDLAKYGVVERKTFKLNKLPNIDEKFMPDLIRGFFDGDGIASLYLTDCDKLCFSFGFCGQRLLMEDIQSYLIEKLDLNKTKIRDRDTISYVSFWSKQNIIDFYNYIYYRDDVLHLTRKKEKFETYFKVNKIDYK